MKPFGACAFAMLVFITSGAFTSCQKEDPGQPGPNEVWLEYQLIRPSQISVTAGTTVKFINKGNPSHTLIGAFTSPLISTDETYEYTFSTPGVYYLNCGTHANVQSEQVAVNVQ